MAEEFANKIKRLELENFTCFGKVAMDFSPGINVFIGENGTGKTHLLKALYAVKNGRIELPIDKEAGVAENDLYIENETKEIFGISDSTLLVKSNSGDRKLSISIDSLVSPLENGNRYITTFTEFLFIPTQEMLSWQRGFINLYSNKEMDLDSTYFDLALALDGNLLKGDAQKEAEKLVGELEKTLKIKVQKRDRKFYISFIEKNEEHDAALVATGINKIAQLIYLIMNGSLTKKTIIFWDEPETNLNPKYIIVVAKFLQTLAKAGCQIFVATHDYLLVNELSMSVQFRDVKKDVPEMKFFSLVKGEDGTEILEGEIIAEIQNNPILDAYAKQAETQLGLYAKSLQPTEQ